jgi:hypothetical protein
MCGWTLVHRVPRIESPSQLLRDQLSTAVADCATLALLAWRVAGVGAQAALLPRTPAALGDGNASTSSSARRRRHHPLLSLSLSCATPPAASAAAVPSAPAAADALEMRVAVLYAGLQALARGQHEPPRHQQQQQLQPAEGEPEGGGAGGGACAAAMAAARRAWPWDAYAARMMSYQDLCVFCAHGRFAEECAAHEHGQQQLAEPQEQDRSR